MSKSTPAATLPNEDIPVVVDDVDKKHPYQSDNNVGWRNMLIYWTIGGIVGYYMGYTQVFSSAEAFGSALATIATNSDVRTGFLVCLVLTIIGRLILNSRYMGFNRSLDVPAILFFAVANCTLETFLFLASYELGKSFVNHTDHPLASAACGLFVFFNYSGLIHALFWLPHVFPKHVRPNSPSFFTHGLPALTLFSVAWMAFFEVVGQDQDSAPAVILAICLCHFVVDSWAGYTMRLERPTGLW